MKTQCRTCGIVWDGEVTTCPNCGEVITVVELPPSEIGNSLKDSLFWFMIGGFPGLIVGAILNSKHSGSEVEKLRDHLKVGLTSAVIGVIAQNLVIALQLVIIPARLLPSGSAFHPSLTLEYVFTSIVGSYLLAWMLGVPLGAFYNRIPTNNAVTKSLILCLGLALLFLIPSVLYPYDKSIYSFLFRQAFDAPPLVVLGLTMGLVFEKLKSSRIDNQTNFTQSSL